MRWGSRSDVSWRSPRSRCSPSPAPRAPPTRPAPLTGQPYKLYALRDPALANTGNDDSGQTDGRTLVARDEQLASALAAEPAPTRLSSGYMGASDGWTDLRDDFRMDWAYARAPAPGNIVQTAELPVTGTSGHRRATLALGFGASAPAASSTTRAALAGGFASAADRYAADWHAYLSGLERPRSAAGHPTLYDVSAMVLAALEDKTYRGAGIASPSMAWVWGTLADSGPYHLVWSRDLYQVATAQIAADDRDIRSTLPVVDRELGVTTPNGQFWHRYNYDGYGETPDGSPFPGAGNRGRLWPLLAGERGEYELAAGELSRDAAGARRAAAARLDAIAATASEGWMLPEQVWDDPPPAGRPGFAPGTGTLSDTPLAWTHAQFVRLAWSIDAGRPVERPDAVACRYAKRCR